jgi:hypothetical protein
MPVVIVSGPDWATIMTAFGTVGAVIAAVWIAVASGRSARTTAADERTRQFEHSDRQLLEQRTHSDLQLETERNAADARLQQQFEQAERLEQQSQAGAIVVIDCEMAAETRPGANPGADPRAGRPAVLIVNRSKYAITGLTARLSPDGHSVTDLRGTRRLGDLDVFPEHWTEGITGMLGGAYGGTLAPGAAVRFEGDNMPESVLRTAFVVVRWIDYWEACWEFRDGQVYLSDMTADWLRPGITQS